MNKNVINRQRTPNDIVLEKLEGKRREMLSLIAISVLLEKGPKAVSVMHRELLFGLF
ncbi:hypothetical protein [Paenibacillus terrae]|uniref:hypothetical protein n=1 Tax=Paenibacillus terrae TaxID=159743 RepID=UPI00165689EC|nr:hypothetical protein [Paenibacillus terrae]